MINSFFDLANWALTSSILLLFILIIRRTNLAAKLSHTLCYALWLPVLLRLLIPMQLLTLPFFPSLPESSTVSGTVTEIERDNTYNYAPTVPSNQGAAQIGTSPLLPTDTEKGDSSLYSTGDTTTVRGEKSLSAAEVALLAWKGGAVALAAVILASNLAFTLRLRRRRARLDGSSASLPIYTVEGLGSPCLAGLLRPAIYLSPEDAREAHHLHHIVAHEESHHRGGDHVWSVLRAAALCLHWYNPLVWYAVVLSKRDAELACDERTLRRLGGEERTAYGETLLSLTMAKPNARNLLSCSTAMVGDKKTLRERIEGIAHSRQTRAAAAFVVIAILALALVFAFGKQKPADEYDEFLQHIEAAEQIAYCPSVYSSAYYPVLTDPELVAEAKELLRQIERADERDVPEVDALNILMSPSFSLYDERCYHLLAMDDVTLLYQRVSGTDMVEDSSYTLVGKYTSLPIDSRLRELSREQKAFITSIDEMDEPRAVLYYEVKTDDGYSNGVDAITSLILKNDGLCAQWEDTKLTLVNFLNIQRGGHRLYYGVSSDDLQRSVTVQEHWFLKTVNEDSYAFFDIPDDLLDDFTARFAQYDANALRFLTSLDVSDISSAVLTTNGNTETALEDGLRDQIFDSLRDIAREELFREVTGEDTLRNYPTYSFSVALELPDNCRVVLFPMTAEKGSVFMMLVSETENRRFVLESESSYYIYRLIFSAAGVGDTNDEARQQAYQRASVAGSETDLEYVARSIGEQIAASWLTVSDETVWKPTDAYLSGSDVFDIYYGENGEGRNFCADLSWKMKFDSRFSANYWEAGAGLFGPDENGYYDYGLECLFRIGSDGKWHLVEYGTGGYSVDCGINLYSDGTIKCESLVKAFFLTEGQTHEYRIPYYFCDLSASERAKLGTVLDGYSSVQASDFVRAVSDHLAQYPSYHDLTAETFRAELPDKYKDFAPILAAEPFWTGDAGSGRFALYDYGKTEWALLYETGDVHEIVTTFFRDATDPNDSIAAYTMDDLLGFPGVAVQTDAVGGVHKSYSYYALTEYGVQYVAYSFGFYDDPRKEVVSVDLDGDGRSELITNNTYGADGAERVRVFRWNGSDAEVGSPDWGRVGVTLDGIGAMNYQERYDTARGVVTLTYDRGSGTKTAELPFTPESFMWLAIDEL